MTDRKPIPPFPPGYPLRRTLAYAAAIACATIITTAAFLGGRYVERNVNYSSPQEQLQLGIKALRTNDDQLALSVLKPLADRGDAKAQFWLADLYANGLGVQRDMTTAVNLLEKSAHQGFVLAERRLGELYLDGDQTVQDFGKASTWLHKAASAGDRSAERDLGRMYELGLGVSRDTAQAYAWYEAATLAGDGFAAHRRDDLVTRMSQDQIAHGEALAKSITSGGSAHT